MMAKLLPATKSHELVVDRAHRLPKLSYLSERVPRDMIARIHYFHIKDQLMYFSRKHKSLPEPYSGILLYIDLSQATIQAYKNLLTITKILRNNNILYKWKFLTKLSFEMNNKTWLVSTLAEGLELIKSCGLLLPDDKNISDAATLF